MTMKSEMTPALTPAFSPGGEGEHCQGAENFLISIAITDSVSFTNQTHDNPAYHTAQNAADDSPSPGGEGRGEGERESNSTENVEEPGVRTHLGMKI